MVRYSMEHFIFILGAETGPNNGKWFGLPTGSLSASVSAGNGAGYGAANLGVLVICAQVQAKA